MDQRNRGWRGVLVALFVTFACGLAVLVLLAVSFQQQDELLDLLRLLPGL